MFDAGDAWTVKTCEHCVRVADSFCRATGADEWDWVLLSGWLEDVRPEWLSQLRAHWQDGAGGLLPFPVEASCTDCGVWVEWGRLWCGPCDRARVARITGQLVEIKEALKGLVS